MARVGKKVYVYWDSQHQKEYVLFHIKKKTLRLRKSESNSCEWNLQYHTQKVVNMQDSISDIKSNQGKPSNFCDPEFEPQRRLNVRYHVTMARVSYSQKAEILSNINLSS